MLKLNGKNKKVLIIPDSHTPYHFKGTRKFLLELKRTFKPDIVINMGDEVDNHAISFHDSIGELFSAGHELEIAKEYLKSDFESVFPKQFILDSNHGSLITRKLKHHGVPIAALKTLKQIYGTPKWSWHDELILQTNRGPVYFCHGKSSAPLKLAQTVGMSTVQGHFHSSMRVNWAKFAGDRMVFDLISGCLVDPSSEAFSYGKNLLHKPILGCSLIHANGNPELVLI